MQENKKSEKILNKGLDTFKKVGHEASEFIGNKIAATVTKPNDDDIEKKEPVEKIIIPPEEREVILSKNLAKSFSKYISFKASMLRPDLCDYSNAYIVVNETITVEGTNDAIKKNKKITFKENDPLRSCISKIYNTVLDNAENFDIVMPLYNLLEYSDNYSMISGSLWNYYRDEINVSANGNNDADNYRINDNKTITSKSFKYKTKIIGKTVSNNNILNAEVVVPLKFAVNF